MRKLSIPCDFGGSRSTFSIYVGAPEPKHHPIHFQAEWIAKYRGGSIPGDVMESLSKLFELPLKNNVPFEELCSYAINTTEAELRLEEANKVGAPPPPADMADDEDDEIPPPPTPTMGIDSDQTTNADEDAPPPPA